MWIKNLIVYRLPASWAVEAEDLERKLAKTPLQRCGGFQMESRGWTCPFEEEQYLYNQNRHWLLALGMEEKLLPASIIRQEALDRAEKIAKSQAHPVGRKQLKNLWRTCAAPMNPVRRCGWRPNARRPRRWPSG